ncbi:hemolysin family protein [Acetomicrobium sp. S15 = DSM 107314]|uniref:hemolysin family protein n=1 Tax=Acetomicrobium sp. S15 = DSM 107314 TaxID=2529858 RepID=UPI0018E0D0BE|nr:hemolysin family protein [Acetomicrobium sp. S15 = DSM 107314]
MGEDLPESIYLLVFLLCFSAFFSASESAITAVRRSKLLSLTENFPKRKKVLDWLIEDIHRPLTITLISNNLVNIAASSVATSIAVAFFGDKGIFLAIIAMTILIVVFGEILPKSIAIVHADKMVLLASPLLRVLSIPLSPVVWCLVGMVRAIGKAFHIEMSPHRVTITREEIEQMIKAGEASGSLEADEERMIRGVIEFEETRVYEIMVPRTDMVAISSTTPIAQAARTFCECGHSRLPVYETDTDHIVGILHVKDILESLASGRADDPVSYFMREPLFVPDSAKISEVFDTMRTKKVHMAIVVDEYGGTAGLVTLEDLLEEIVGEIQDEYDEESLPVVKESENSYLVEGQLNLDDLSEYLGYPFESEEADSVAGFVLALAGRFLEPGEEVRYGPWTIEVVNVEGYRVKLLRFRREEEREEEPQGS